MADNDKEFADAIQGLDSVLNTSAGPRSLQGIDGKSLCRDYQRIKSFLEKALPFIEKIPMWGKQIAAAIRLLMGIADTLCPAA
ncbi:MAG: hypothetical protein M3O61_08825 [Gemmatimonadota bacterium]|nr:hypothetical protein [Gemmatimonadota bacterium]